MKKKLISAQDVEALLKKGGDLKSLPSDALWLTKVSTAYSRHWLG